MTERGVFEHGVFGDGVIGFSFTLGLCVCVCKAACEGWLGGGDVGGWREVAWMIGGGGVRSH